MHLRLLPLLAAVVALCLGCAARRIPGSDIEDTPDTRAILGVLEQYRAALEARDANKILQLVSEQFKDNGGTASPEDDLDYAALRRVLPERLARLEDVKVDFSVRRVVVEKDTASVIYYYNTHYRLPRLTTKVVNEGDLEQMVLRKVGGTWKILTGI